MKTNNNTARILGFLFLLNLIPYVIAHLVLIDDLLYAPNFPVELSANRTKIGWSALMEFTSMIAMISFAVIFFPILRKFGNKLAIGYLGIRFVEFGVIIFSIIKLISLVEFSESIVVYGNTNAPYMQLLADSLLNEWEWIGTIYMLVYILHCVVFFYLLFKSRLVPIIIPIIGLIGAILAFANIINHLFDLSFGGFYLFAPMILIELILALWLLFFGFKTEKYDALN